MRAHPTLAPVLLALASACGGSSTDVPCTGDEQCVKGQSCQSGICRPALCGGVRCPAGEACALEKCLPTVCGAVTCADGSVCKDGACAEIACLGKACEAGLACQAGECVDCPGGQLELSCSNGKDDDCDLAADCADDDCAGRTCAAGKICIDQACAEPTCSDGVQYGEETDVDCGGPCAPCADGRKCRASTDCQSSLCRALLCAPASCADTLKNGGESDIDCGGSQCPQCDLGQACNSGADCATWACAAGACVTPKSCQEIKASAPVAKDGLYTIDPDGTGAGAAMKVHCLMSVLEGGWTLVQRTVWDWADSSKLHTTYADFYGKTLGLPDPGKAYRAAAKLWPGLAAKKEHLMVHTARKSADGKSCLPLYYKATAGAWAITSTGARITGYQQPVTLFNAADVSTEDKGPSITCVTNNNAVPWTYGSCCTTCPTFGGKYFTTARPMASYLATYADALGKKLADQCGGAAATSSLGYYGLNAMEYYVR